MLREKRELRELECGYCHKTFKQRVWWQKYCSESCGGKARFDKYLDNHTELNPSNAGKLLAQLSIETRKLDKEPK